MSAAMRESMHARDVGAALAAMRYAHAADEAAPEGASTGDGPRFVGAALAAMRCSHAADVIAPEGAPTGDGARFVGAALTAMRCSHAADAIAPEGAPPSGNDGDRKLRPSSPHSADIRAGRVSIIGQMYLITSVTMGRGRLFDDARLARVVVQTLRQLAEGALVDSHAFVVMPDHLHWLITLRTGTLSALMARAKGNSARQINQLLGRSGEPVWQAGFHDHALRRDENVREVARYIVANPVRAGIVGNVRDYPWWDAEWL